MIYAAYALLAVGLVDLLRRYVAARALIITCAVGAVALVVFGALAAVPIAAVVAVAIAALWVWLLPSERTPRLAFWPAIALGLYAAIAVVTVPARESAGVFGRDAVLSPLGEVPFDVLMLAVGVGLVMLETGNEIVRAALRSEQLPVGEGTLVDKAGTAEISDATGEAFLDTAEAASAASTPSAPYVAVPPEQATFRGGRLIGPLERVIVLMLTLAVAYSLLAAMLAAKGIVRFPEISRDRGSGARAEYFLVGSLVSWTVALSGAFLLWWAASATGLR